MNAVISRCDSDDYKDLAVLLKEFQLEIAGYAGYSGFNPDADLIEERFCGFLDMPDYGVFIARTPKGHLLGFCSAFPMPVGIREEKFAILDRIYVRESYRRQNIGHRLLSEAKHFARSCKCQRLQLTMPAFFSLESAVAFFNGEHFYKTGGRKHKIALGSL